MQFKIFLLAASAGVAIATAPTTMCTDGCNPIALPSLGELVPVSTPFTITWTPTTPGTVSIQLLRGPSTNVQALGPQLVSGLANTGTYSWTPDASLVPDTTHYGLQIINDADGTFQYSVQFGISNPSYSSSSASATGVSSSASGSATLAPTKNATSAYSTTTKAYVASTGYPSSNTTSVISPSAAMTVPSTLASAAASSTLAGAASSSSTTASTTAKASSGAAALGMSMGGAVIALAGAVFAL